MEDVDKLQAFLRVLYTVNNNPQYILAKSSSQVPTIVCSGTTTRSAADGPTYGRAPLKACLTAVCDSSPELLQDCSRDFSLYVLDPLEAQPLPANLARQPDNARSPHGVAVALGLMSRALASDDSTSVLVTGTIVPNASPALEVIFALRETKRMPKPVLHSYPSSDSMFAPGPPPQTLDPRPFQAPGTGWPSDSYLQRDHQEQRNLARSTDFPELYIGPPRRAIGRPGRSTSSRSKTKPLASSSSLPAASSSQAVGTRPESMQETRRKSKQKSKSRPSRTSPTHSPFTSGPLTRQTAVGLPPEVRPTDGSSLHPRPAQNPLLGVLSAIPPASDNTPSDATSGQHAVLLSALQQLLVANPHLLQLAATNTVVSASSGRQTVDNKPSGNAGDEHGDADSDIVILDSSSIDTSVFRKPSLQQHAARDNRISPLLVDQESPMPNSQGADSSPLPASSPPSGHEETPESSQKSTATLTPEANTPTLRQTERGNVDHYLGLNFPATPTPSRTRKRKLEEYDEDQARSSTSTSTSTSPPSPSPSVIRLSSSGRTWTAGQRILSSPIGGVKSVSSPSARLPSMLNSMRNMSASGSRLWVGCSGSPVHGNSTCLTTDKNGGRPAALFSGPSGSEVDHSKMKAASSNIASDTTSLKRKLKVSLNEFMEEREARKNAMARKRSSLGRKPEVEIPMTADGSRAGPSRASKVGVTSRNARSSPPRPLFRTDRLASSFPASTCPPSDFNPAMTASTSTMSTAATAPTNNNPLKNFVMPAWARTSTTMLPRLSEEASARQRAEQEAKRAQISLRRREAAKAKRKRLRGAERPKESSDEGDENTANDPRTRTLRSHSTAMPGGPLPPALPVFASDAIEPIPSSPPRMHGQLVTLPIPSTPPRKPVSPASAPRHSPSKAGSYSLFTPSGQDQGSLFTPSTPSAARSLTRAMFTPRSPTALHPCTPRRSPQKGVLQTPKRGSAHRHQTPGSSRSGKSAPFASPNFAMRTPQGQSVGMRAFLLPPPSPGSLRTPHRQNLRSSAPGSAAQITPGSIRIAKQGSPSSERNVERNGTRGRQFGDVLVPEDTSIIPTQHSPERPTVGDGDGRETSEPRDVASNEDASQVGLNSSPLPPSSPLPASPISSPARRCDGDFDDAQNPNDDSLVMPDSDVLLPSATDSEGPQAMIDMAWLSDDASCAASWFADSETSAWLSETEAWLTEDTEGGGSLLTDSDAVFGDVSRSSPSLLLPSSASNWFSDDADVDTDGGEGVTVGAGNLGAFDAVAFERVFAALVAREGGGVERGGGGDSAPGGTHDAKVVEPELWESARPPLGGNAPRGAGDVEDEAARDTLRELLDRLVDA